MKLDNETLDVLKNFASINPSLLVKQGNVVRTLSLSSSVIARAKLKQSFESTFAIYDLSNFISAVSLFDQAILDFTDDRFVTITNEAKTAIIQYFYADPSLLILPPDKELGTPSSNIKFRVTVETLSDITKAVSVLSLPEVLFVGDGSNVAIQAINPKSPTSNFYRKVIATAEAEFMAYFKVENLKLVPNEYDVTISSPKSKGGVGIAHFNSPNIEYWIAVEQHSKL